MRTTNTDEAHEPFPTTLPPPSDDGWTSIAPTLSPEEYDTALAIALATDFARVCKRHDFRDGDVCSRCDALHGEP